MSNPENQLTADFEKTEWDDFPVLEQEDAIADTDEEHDDQLELERKISKFIEEIRQKNDYGEDEQALPLSEQHDEVKRVLGMSAEDFDAAFTDGGRIIGEEAYNKALRDRDRWRKILLAFMRGELRLTRYQATDMLIRQQITIYGDDDLAPYRPAADAMRATKKPWAEWKRAKNEKKMELIEKSFLSDDETMHRTVDPYIEKVRDDKETLMRIVYEIDFGNASTKQVQGLVDYFAEKFDIGDNPPQVKLTTELEKGCRGALHASENRMEIAVDSRYSVAEMVEAIAHETWHAHQDFAGDEVYDYNMTHIVSAHLDFDLYRHQIVEREAFEVGERISDIVRKEYLKTHPKEVSRMAQVYADRGYERDIHGLDKYYFKMAYMEFNKPKPHRRLMHRGGLFGGFKGFRSRER